MADKMVLRVKIENFERYGKSGWQWTINGSTIRTNSEGNGLFHVSSTGDVQQTSGTMQFQLPSNDKAAAYDELVKLYSVPEWQVY